MDPDKYVIFEALAGFGDLDAAVDTLCRMPKGTPERGRMAARLIAALSKATDLLDDVIRGGNQIARLRDLLEIAEQDPPPDADWPRVRDATRLTTALAATAFSPGQSSAMAAQIDAVAAENEDPAMRPLIEAAQMMAGVAHSAEEGDEAYYARMAQHAGTLGRMMPNNPQAAALTEVMQDMAQAMTVRQRGGDAVTALRGVQEKLHRLMPGSPLAAMMDESMTLVAPFAGSFDGSPKGSVGIPTPDQVADIDALIAGPGEDGPRQALRHLAAGGAALGGWDETDAGRITQAVEHFRAALEHTPANSPDRPQRLGSIALALLRRSELTHDMADLDEAAQLLEEARGLAGGPQHPQWGLLGSMLTEIQLRRGAPEPHKFALDALRNVAWTVLLQGNATAARYAASDAADTATRAAQRCLAHSDLVGAIQALDGGRSLMLFAATEFSNVASRLAAAGRPDLAERWRQAADEAPDLAPAGLRSEVLGVLDEDSGLLDPPQLAEIQEALRRLDADALVYLVPALGDDPGFAVMAPAEGVPGLMILMNLKAGAGADREVENYFSTLANRDFEPAVAQSALADSLDTLCSWAWRVAMGPIIEQYLPELPKPASGRPYRLVLVPMGELALIPWQAARSHGGKYALESVAFSYAASARMLCRSAALPPVSRAPIGLVVGDPDTDSKAKPLKAARAEAFAIHQAFYRGGRYVGRRPDGTPSRAGGGKPQEVRDWLTATRPGAGAMLHLACHGVIKTGEGDPTSYLVLAGGDRITAQEIIRLLTNAPDRGIGLAVLAACRTGRAIDNYDEAYSLGTAFLAGGARSVLSTLWAIPDQATSVLMFMFHHYLMVRGLPAWEALREAQLWMLKPDRVPPESMPTALCRQLAGADAARVEAWAGFVHWGQ
jgi:hypothetical protein